MTEDDPYVLKGWQPRSFWAESVADKILEREPADPIVIKGGISPSGVPHLGNMNEIMRGYFVAESLRDRDHTVRQVFTADDRDPLRKLPRKLADLEGNIVDLGDVNAGVLGRNLGKPYTAIPDPFGCCESYGKHFSNLIERSAKLLGIRVDTVSNTHLYESGKFEDITRYLLEHREQARAVLSEYQDKVDDKYVPFNPICAECGKLTETVTDVNLDMGTVEYVCTDMEAGDQVIEGCGHEGTATFRDGKLPWRFEWPAQWQVLDVDFEPFGKDHAEGSWPSGTDITRNILGDVPPVPMAYEWFTLNGEAFSSSSGHVIMVQDVLKLIEPEILRYFFTKDPSTARDFSIEYLDQLMNEFDEIEEVYYSEFTAGPKTRDITKAAYPAVIRPTVASRFDENGNRIPDPGHESVPITSPDRRMQLNDVIDTTFQDRVRLPYTFAAVLGMTDDSELREAMARRENHIPDDTPEWAIEDALARVERARTWAERTDNAYNYRLETDCPDVAFDNDTEAALSDLAEFVEAGHDGEAVQGEIFETARRHDLSPRELFTAGYQLFLGTEQGPKLGPFLTDLDREFVVQRLRRDG